MGVSEEFTSSLQVFGFILFFTNLKEPLFPINLGLSMKTLQLYLDYITIVKKKLY